MVTLLLVMAGGAVGAVCRFLVDRAATPALRGNLPVGTFIVNVTGSLLLGLVAGAASGLPGWAAPLIGTGFCGALTTYSTFGYETVRLAGSEPYGRSRAALNVLATLLVGLAAVGAGRLLAASF